MRNAEGLRFLQARGPPLPDITSSAELRRMVASKQAGSTAALHGPGQVPSAASSDLQRPLDRSVPADVRTFAATSTDAHVLFVKVRPLSSFPSSRNLLQLHGSLELYC